MAKDQQQKSGGALTRNWMTIVLVVVLIILGLILFFILKDPRQFEMFKKKKEAKPEPLKLGINQQFQDSQDSYDQFNLQSPDSRLRLGIAAGIA